MRKLDWVCPVCGEAMRSQGGYNHLRWGHDLGRDEAKRRNAEGRDLARAAGAGLGVDPESWSAELLRLEAAEKALGARCAAEPDGPPREVLRRALESTRGKLAEHRASAGRAVAR